VVTAPVIVTVLALPGKVGAAPDVSQLPVMVHAPVVSVSVPDAPPVIVTFDALTADAFAVNTPPSSMVIAPPVRPRLLVASVVAPAPPWTAKVPDQMRRFVAMVNVTVDGPLLNAMSVNSAAPPGRTAKVIVWETDELNVMDAAKFQDADVDVCVQDPETVHEPEGVIAPEVPPVIVTLVALTTDVPAVKVAPLFTVRFPPGPVSARFPVERVALLLSVSVPPHRRPFVTMVNVAAAVGLNCTLLNSETPKLAKVIVRDEPELKTTVPVPTDHDPLVDEFVHEPPKFQVAAPKLKYPAAAMLTFPVMVFVPAAPAVIPPAMFAARVATVNVKVPLARTEPPFTVNVPETSTSPDWVTVPAAEMTRLLKLLLAFRMAMLATPLIVTVLVPFVNTEPAPLVSQLPVLVNELVVSVIVPLVPPVIATPVALVNVTVPVPALHEADVEAFVQVPVTVQVDEPMTTYTFAALTFTLPLTTMADLCAVRLQ